MKTGVLAILVLAAPAAAQSGRSELDRDGRFQTVDYSKSALFQILTAPATTQTVVFGAGERIQSIVLSVPGSYAIDVAGRGDNFTLKPNGRATLSIASVRTDRRTYELELVPSQPGFAPLVVRFTYDGSGNSGSALPLGPASSRAAGPSRWKVSGDKALRPTTLRDDGKKTYIVWPEDQALPAVFALGPGGKEEMVEGYIRAGIFTIDRVYDRLTFRIDRRTVTARRKADRGQAND